MSIFERISPYCYKTCSEIPYSFFCVYVFTLILFFPLVLKILMSVRHEYYGIFVWQLIHASCVGSSLRKHDFDIINSYLNCQDFILWSIRMLLDCRRFNHLLITTFSAGNEKLVYVYCHWNSGCSNNEQTLYLISQPIPFTWICVLLGESVFLYYCLRFRAFENLIFQKTLREGIEDSDRRDSHYMWDRLEVFYRI